MSAEEKLTKFVQQHLDELLAGHDEPKPNETACICVKRVDQNYKEHPDLKIDLCKSCGAAVVLGPDVTAKLLEWPKTVILCYDCMVRFTDANPGKFRVGKMSDAIESIKQSKPSVAEQIDELVVEATERLNKSKADPFKNMRD